MWNPQNVRYVVVLLAVVAAWAGGERPAHAEVYPITGSSLILNGPNQTLVRVNTDVTASTAGNVGTPEAHAELRVGTPSWEINASVGYKGAHNDTYGSPPPNSFELIISPDNPRNNANREVRFTPKIPGYWKVSLTAHLAIPSDPEGDTSWAWDSPERSFEVTSVDVNLVMQGLNEETDSSPNEEDPGAAIILYSPPTAVSLVVAPTDLPNATATFDVSSGSEKVKVWDNPDRTGDPVPMPQNWGLGAAAVPGTLYVEGVAVSDNPRDIELKLTVTSGGESVSDRVLVTVEGIDLVIQDLPDETNATPHEHDPGAYIPLNFDFDEENTDGATPPVFRRDNQADLTWGPRIVSSDKSLVPAKLILQGSGTGSWTLNYPHCSDVNGTIYIWKSDGDDFVWVTSGTAYEVTLPATIDLRIEGICTSKRLTDIPITATFTPATGDPIWQDSAVVTVIAVDVDIDSDNNNGTNEPEYTDLEEQYEDVENDPLHPGKLMLISGGDSDGDGIPNFADGFDVFDDTNDDNLSNGYTFVPVRIKLEGPIDINKVALRLTYSASDPRNPNELRSGTHPNYTYHPAPGNLRLWKKQGHEARNKASFASGGDYVPPTDPSSTYSGSQLVHLGFADGKREVVLYVEAVRASSQLTDPRIEVQVLPQGDSGKSEWVVTDAVRLTVLSVDLDVDSDNDNDREDPSRSGAEDAIESVTAELTQVIGKSIPVNYSDGDQDGIPGFADGYDRDGLSSIDDDQTTVTKDKQGFTPVIIELVDSALFPDATVTFSYQYSDPSLVTLTSVADADNGKVHHVYGIPTSPDDHTGAIRIWSRSEEQKRSAAGMDEEGGTMIKPGVPYAISTFDEKMEKVDESANVYRLWVEGIRDSRIIGDVTIQMHVRLTGNNGSSLAIDDTVAITVGAPMLRFDYDRDGEIRWNDTSDLTHPDDPDSGDLLDRTTCYRFWVNNDTDSVAPTSSIDAKTLQTHEWELYTDRSGIAPNCDNATIDTTRDLEDWTRVSIRLPEYINATNRHQFVLKARFVDNRNGAPRIRLMRAFSPGRGYLYAQNEAEWQIQYALGEYISYIGSGYNVSIGDEEVTLSIDDLFMDSSSSLARVAPCLFEAAAGGKGALQVRLVYTGGSSPMVMAADRQWVSLEDITRFFEQYTMGGDAEADINDAAHGQTASREPGSIRFSEPDVANRPWERNYVLAVHGYNVSDYHKRQWFAATMYKRLWHVGFQGRLGMLYWPTHLQGLVPRDFDHSEYNAWRAGQGVHELLKELNTRFAGDSSYQDKIRLYAHSQGNVLAMQGLFSRPTVSITDPVQVGDSYCLSLETTDAPLDLPGGPLPQYVSQLQMPTSVTAGPNDGSSDVLWNLMTAWNQSGGFSGTHVMAFYRGDYLSFYWRERRPDNSYRVYNVPLSMRLVRTRNAQSVDMASGIEPLVLISHFISSQAAVAASALEPSAPVTAYTGGAYGAYPETADIYARSVLYPPTLGRRNYALQLEGLYAGLRASRFFNTKDYATFGLWETKQAAKGSSATGIYDGIKYMAALKSYGQQVDQLFLISMYPRALFRDLAYAVEGRMALGTASAGSLGGGLFASAAGLEVDMEALWGFTGEHRFHSAQFNGYLAEKMTASQGKGTVWQYWLKCMDSMDMEPLSRGRN